LGDGGVEGRPGTWGPGGGDEGSGRDTAATPTKEGGDGGAGTLLWRPPTQQFGPGPPADPHALFGSCAPSRRARHGELRDSAVARGARRALSSHWLRSGALLHWLLAAQPHPVRAEALSCGHLGSGRSAQRTPRARVELGLEQERVVQFFLPRKTQSWF
jgi:hypothetical protein